MPWSNPHPNAESLGLEVQHDGVPPPSLITPTREILSLGGLGELNADDGSFPFQQDRLGRFGLAGIIFYALVIWYWLRLEKQLSRTWHRGNSDHSAIVQAALIILLRGLQFYSRRERELLRGGGLLL